MSTNLYDFIRAIVFIAMLLFIGWALSPKYEREYHGSLFSRKKRSHEFGSEDYEAWKEKHQR